DAVSDFVVHIGSIAFMTSPTSTECTGSSPNIGFTYVAKVAVHCVACLELRQPARCAAIYASAHSAKVIDLATLSRAATRLAFLASMGSLPSRRTLRCAAARSRASAREMSG